MNSISIFGGHGFILSQFYRSYGGHIEDKHDIVPLYPKILYGISTVSNYNVLDDPHVDIDTNLSMFMTILLEARKSFGSNVEVNLCSTWFTYGKIKDLPARESSPCNPQGFYSITALAREKLLASYCDTFGMKFRIFRLANVLGEADRKISAKKNALQYLIREMVNDRPIKVYYEGKFIRDYIDVEDVCKAMWYCLDEPTHQIYNISNGEPLRFIDLIYYCANKLGYNRDKIEFIDGTDFHKQVQVKSMYLDNSKIKRMGYKPSYTIYQTLDRLMEYYKHGN